MVQPHGKEGPFSPGGPEPAWGGRSRGSPGRRRSERRQPAPRPGRRAAENPRGHSSTTESSRRRRLASPAPPGEEGRQLPGPPVCVCGGVFSLGPRKVSRKRREAAGLRRGKARERRPGGGGGAGSLQAANVPPPPPSVRRLHSWEREGEGGSPGVWPQRGAPRPPRQAQSDFLPPSPAESHRPRLAWRCLRRTRGGGSLQTAPPSLS